MPDTTPLTRTLADLLIDLEQDSSLSADRRRDLKSAVRRICELLGRDPASLPAAIAALRGAVNDLTPGGAGVSAKTLQNLRSNFLAALRHSAAGSTKVGLTPAWQALYDRLPDKRSRDGLSRFLRLCSARGLEPEAVDDAVIEAFVAWLSNATLVRKPRELHRRSCRLWNAAVDSVPGWPAQRLAVPDYRQPRRTVPLSDLPISFRQDVERYLGWLTDPDPFDDERPRTALKPRTVKLRRDLIGLAVSAWIGRGHDCEGLGSLGDLVAVEAAKEVFRFYLAQNKQRSPAFLHNLAQLLFSIAREWVRADEAHLEGLRDVRRHLPPVPTGMTDKNRALLRQFEDPETLRRLLNLPRKLLAAAGKDGAKGKRAAIKAQLALALEFRLMAPIRMVNLIDVRVGHELVRVGNHGRPYRLVIAATETKNTEPIEFELPAELSDMIDLYLRDHHPLLTRPGNPYLFPAAAGGHKAQGTLSQQLQGLLYTHLGFKMTPHQFRHLSAWLYLRRRPGDFVTVQKLLGHKNIKTTMNFYAGLDTTTAARHYDALIAEERDPDETPPRPRRRRS